MAGDFMERALWCLGEAREALSKGNHPITVRRSQEALELAVKVKRLMRRLATDRGPAFYGFERSGIPARKAFGKREAREAFRPVEGIVRLCAELVEGKA